MALLGCTEKPVMVESRREALVILVESTPVQKGMASWRTRSAMTISSIAALPARSPMPLMVHSTWRAPPRKAASELATPRPRSLWLWVDSTAWSMFGTRSRSIWNSAKISSGTV